MATTPLPSVTRDLEAERVESVEGWLSRAEIELLLDLAARVPAAHAIVEIGNYRGRSTVALALGARRGGGAQVYSIDPHVEFIGPRGGRFGREDQAHLYANLARLGVGAQVSVIGLDSRSVAAAWTGQDVGLLFVDGDHRYESVSADIRAWRPYLAPGALVAFDDCDYPDVVRLVRALVSAGELVPRGSAGKVAWFTLA